MNNRQRKKASVAINAETARLRNNPTAIRNKPTVQEAWDVITEHLAGTPGFLCSFVSGELANIPGILGYRLILHRTDYEQPILSSTHVYKLDGEKLC